MATRFVFVPFLLATAFLLCVASTSLPAQSRMLVLGEPDLSDFPDVSVLFYALDGSGNQVRSLSPGDFTVMENWSQRSVIALTCPSLLPPMPVSAVLSIDISSSMNAGLGSISRIDLAREGARAWADQMRGSDECALSSFNELAYLDQDFTSNRQAVLNALPALVPKGETDFNEGLLGSPAGSITVAGRGNNKRVVVMLTDGKGVVDVENTIARAVNLNIEIYCVVLGESAGSNLKSIASGTGGLCYDNVRTVEEIRKIYQIIYKRAQGVEPCRLTWRSEFSCFTYRSVEITANRYGLSASTLYSIPALVPGRLVITPGTLFFGAVTPGRTSALKVRLTAEEAPITLQSLVPSTPFLSVKEVAENPNFLPTTLDPGESLDLTVLFSPVDSSLVQGEIRVKTNLCEDKLIRCAGGFDPNSRPTIRILHPDGGEKFEIGLDTVIRWDGVGIADPVRLEYSINSGSTWTPITTRAVGFSHPWHVPATPSNQCLARATLLNPDRTVALLSHNGAVVDAKFLSNEQVATLEEGGTIRTWDIPAGRSVRVIPAVSSDHHLVLSPNGRYAATGGNADRTVTVWDLRSGTRLWILPEAYLNGGRGNSPLKSPLSFTADGTALLTAMVEKEGDTATNVLRLYDVATGSILQEIRDLGVTARSATFSSDGSRCAIAGLNGRIRIRDAALTRILQTLVDPNGDVIDLAFDPDGRELLSVAQSASGNYTVTRWNVLSGMQIGSFPLPRPARSIDYSSAAPSYLIADGEAIVRKLTGNETDREFIGHNGPVNTAYFSPDGGMVVTASGDKTARVWKLDNEFVRTDVSDLLWTILPPNIEAPDVEFGVVSLNGSKDTLLTGYVGNAGGSSVEITGMIMTGAEWNEFSILSGNPPFVLAPGEARAVKFRFRPEAIGDREAFLEIQMQGGRLQRRLHGVCIEPQLKIVGLSGDVIDFGPVPLDDVRDSLVWGVNTGTTSLEVTSLTHRGPDDRQFVILSPDLSSPVTLQPGDSVPVRVRFAPVLLGSTQGGVEAGYNREGSPAVFGLLGEGIAPSDPAIAAPDLLEFPVQRCLSASDTMELEIGNPGNAVLQISEARIEGANAADFLLVPSFIPLSIPPGKTDRLRLVFTPSAPGERNGLLLLTSNASNGSDRSVALHGRLATAQLSTQQNSFDLGTVCPGEIVELAIPLWNVGPDSTQVRSLVLDKSGGRTELSSASVALAGEDSAVVTAFFTAADQEGPISGEITFLDTLCGSSVIIRVGGDILRPVIRIDSVAPICAGQEISLVATGGERYRWSPAAGLSCLDCPDPVASPVQTITYSVTGYDADGCIGVDSVTVFVRESPVMIPAAIGRNYRASSGDTVRVAVELQSAAPELADVERLELRFSYDPLVMTVDRDVLQSGLMGTLLDGWQVNLLDNREGGLRLECVRNGGKFLSGPGILLYLLCRPFLAGSPGTEVALEVTASSPCIEFRTTAGYVGVDSICGLSYRLVEIALTKYSLGLASPNPSSGESVSIPFTLGLDGETALEIFDEEGNRVGSPVRAWLTAGAYTVEWGTENIGSGTYYYRLTSGDWSRMGQVIVVK